MESRRQYRKKEEQLVQAVQLRLETEGLTYQKWGGPQQCKRGDWLVDNAGDVYTVDGDVFARTYEPATPGLYRKVTPVWAERATASGHVSTKEGETAYEAGDYIVYNEPDGGDGYAVKAEKFVEMYEMCPQ